MRYYFLGVGGTAMASLAILLKQKGHDVWGSDHGIYPPMSDLLKEHQISVWDEYHPDHLRKKFDKVIIGNALSRGNVEVETILNKGLPFTSLPELVRHEFLEEKQSIVVTGTHGKTTTSALLSWILDVAGYDPSFLIGGIAKNFSSSARLGSGDLFVIEGDEYDCAFFDKRPKFLHYFPQYLIINNIEYDHADIYQNLDEIKDAFRKLLRIVPGNGLIIANIESPPVQEILSPVYSRVQTIGKSSDCDWYYQNFSMMEAGISFEVWQRGHRVAELQFPLPGEYHVFNILGTIGVARDIGIGWQTIKEALISFEGVKRRMENWGLYHGARVYDDFAHHPTAIRLTLEALRKKHVQQRLVALFEPRTNTAVQSIFQKELRDALLPADVVLLAPIYRAERVAPEKRLSLTELSQGLQAKGKRVLKLSDYADILPALQTLLTEGDVLVLLTNGNLGGYYEKLKEVLQG